MVLLSAVTVPYVLLLSYLRGGGGDGGGDPSFLLRPWSGFVFGAYYPSEIFQLVKLPAANSAQSYLQWLQA